MNIDYAPGTIVVALRHVQHREYNVSVMLHPYQVTQMPDRHWLHVLRDVNEDVCRYAMKSGLPVFLPQSEGWAHMDDTSRMAIWPLP